MNDSAEMVLVEFPRELVERIAYRMEAIDDDLDWHAIYTACLGSLSKENNGR